MYPGAYGAAEQASGSCPSERVLLCLIHAFRAHQHKEESNALW